MGRTGHFNKDCLHSTVRNSSGGAMIFGFLPPHGKKLAADAEYTVFGDIREALSRGGHGTDRRHHQSFQAALDRGDIEIVHTPLPILEDATTGLAKMLRLDNGSLSTVDPCWNTSDSLASGTPA